MKTPILLMIFNRPDTTKQVFEAIRKAKPKQLFVAADGPRAHKEGEKEKCDITRQIATQVDWDCEVKTLFRSENKGCGVAPAENITWFFSQVEKGIILEDDCLPDPSFFSFCEEMLDYYQNNLSVGQISGDNFQHGIRRGNASYYFTKYFHICGWATWRDRWKDYSFEITHADDIIRDRIIENKCPSKTEQAFWHRKLEMLRGGKKRDVWDYQWMFANWYLNRTSAVSNVNLITNIGFTTDATHTTQFNSKVANLPTEPITQVIHATSVQEDKTADYYTFFKSGTFFLPTWKDKLRWTLKKILPSKAKNALKQVTK